MPSRKNVMAISGRNSDSPCCSLNTTTMTSLSQKDKHQEDQEKQCPLTPSRHRSHFKLQCQRRGVISRFYYLYLSIILFSSLSVIFDPSLNLLFGVSAEPDPSISSFPQHQAERKLSSRVVTTKYGALRGYMVTLPNRNLQPVEVFMGKIRDKSFEKSKKCLLSTTLRIFFKMYLCFRLFFFRYISFTSFSFFRGVSVRDGDVFATWEPLSGGLGISLFL